jgi:hypothetical protein
MKAIPPRLIAAPSIWRFDLPAESGGIRYAVSRFPFLAEARRIRASARFVRAAESLMGRRRVPRATVAVHIRSVTRRGMSDGSGVT